MEGQQEQEGQPAAGSSAQSAPTSPPPAASASPPRNDDDQKQQPQPPPAQAKDKVPQQPNAAAASSSSSSAPSVGVQQPRPPPQSQAQPTQREPLLRIRVLAVEKRGKELNVRLDAATNLAPFRHSHYPPFLRSYRELTFFALSLAVHVPSQILASLPLPPPTFSALPSPPQAEARILCQALARWFARLAAEPAHRDHPETRNFIEADYSYHPIPPHVDYAPILVQKRWRAVMDHAATVERGISIDLGAGLGLPSGVLSTPAAPTRTGGGGFLGFGGSKSSSSTVAGGKGMSLSRNVHDEDEDLVAARMEVTRLELQFSEAASKGFKVVEARGKVTDQLSALSNRLHTLAGVEDTRQLSSELGLPNDLRKLADGLPAVDLTQQATSHTETMTLLYQLTYQSSNARAAKEALLARNALVEEHHEASKRTMLKKREIEGLKARMGTGGISRDRIEIAIEEYGEASRYANALRMDLARLSKNMHGSLKNHSRNAHADLQAALVDHARGTVFHLKKDIQALKGLRADLRRDQKASKKTEVGEEAGPSQSVASLKSTGDGIVESDREAQTEVGDTTFEALAQSGIPSERDEPEAGLPTKVLPETKEVLHGRARSGEDADRTASASRGAGSSVSREPSQTRQSESRLPVQSPPPTSAPPPLARPPVSNPWTKGSFESSQRFSQGNGASPSPLPNAAPVWSQPGAGSNMTQSLYQPSPSQHQHQQQQQQQPAGGAEGGPMGGSGFLSRSDAGFGSSRGGGAAMRGRGRISASEAARSLAGRF